MERKTRATLGMSAEHLRHRLQDRRLEVALDLRDEAPHRFGHRAGDRHRHHWDRDPGSGHEVDSLLDLGGGEAAEENEGPGDLKGGRGARCLVLAGALALAVALVSFSPSANRLGFSATFKMPAPVVAVDTTPLLFKKWSSAEVEVSDLSLQDYISKRSFYLPHTAQRWNKKRFRKALCPITERLANSLMYHGRNNGKKMLAVRHIKACFDIINLVTDQNPVQVLVDAITKAGPREDSTRVGTAGVVRRQSVDVSPLRRVNQAIYLITTGAREAAFRTIKTFPECLADEIINASKGSSNSYAIKKKDEIERVAKANR